MSGRLAGKVAVVTGGSDGMGKATSHRFVREGARVVVADVQEEKGRAVVEALGPAARFVRCDVREEGDLARAVGVAVEEFGGLDAMTHFAGTAGTQAAIDDMPVDDWDDAMAVLLRGSMLAIKAAIPAMRARGGGSITLTSSAVAYLPSPGNAAAYVTAKGAVVTLARSAALRYAPDFIRVNVIVPGAFATPITLKGLGFSDDVAEALLPHLKTLLYDDYQPIPKAGRTEDIAAAALFLVSDESRFITGTDLRVDGGMSLHRRVARADLWGAIRDAGRRAGIDVGAEGSPGV